MKSPLFSLPRLSSGLSLDSSGLLWQSMISFASAILLIASFPNFDLNFLAWVALAPLLQVIAGGVTWRRALWLGWLMGIVFTFFAENWIAHSMTHFGEMLTVLAYAIALLFAAILAIFPAIFAAVMSLLVSKFGWWATVFAPVAWVATEWLRPMITGITWNALGVSQAEHFFIARLSQYGGVYLISAEIVATSALLVLLLKIRDRNARRAAAILLMTGATMFVLPTLRDPTRPSIGVRVTAVGVQPNLPPNSSDSPEAFARDLEMNIKLTRDAISRAPEGTANIVIWAESPLALFYENDPALRERLNALARETGSYFILNTIVRQSQNYFNSVSVISPHQAAPNTTSIEALKRYDKIRLVPFGEYVPWRPVLGHFVPAIVGDFTPGKEAVVNPLRLETQRAAIIQGNEINSSPAIERTTNYIRVGSFICYEAAYAEIVRKFVNNGATLLVNLSNDAWFGNTAGARQHLSHARMRAIENDRELLRVTNTGISALITADGRVLDPLPMFTPGAQVWEAQSRRSQTFYTKHGDWFAIGCASLTALAVIACLRWPLTFPRA